MRLAASTAAARSFVTRILPFAARDFWAMSRRGRSASWVSISRCTASARGRLSVTSTAAAWVSCSAWLSRSAAAQAGSLFPSATTRISLGPAIMSMATWPNTFRLAAATKTPPGPTILSTRGTVSVP